MAKPEYAIREVSLAEVILFLLSAIILAAYHFDYRVATYIIFLDFFQSFKIIVALRQLMETKRHQKMFGSLPDAYYYDSLLMRKYNWIWTNIHISFSDCRCTVFIFCRFSDNGKKIFETAVFLSGKTG